MDSNMITKTNIKTNIIIIVIVIVINRNIVKE